MGGSRVISDPLFFLQLDSVFFHKHGLNWHVEEQNHRPKNYFNPKNRNMPFFRERYIPKMLIFHPRFLLKSQKEAFIA